jgi:hypothetical protein
MHYFPIKVSIALFVNGKLHISVSMIASRAMVTEVKQWVQLWEPLLNKYGFNCHIRLVWIPWLRNLTLDSPRLSGADIESTSLLCKSAV